MSATTPLPSRSSARNRKKSQRARELDGDEDDYSPQPQQGKPGPSSASLKPPTPSARPKKASSRAPKHEYADSYPPNLDGSLGADDDHEGARDEHGVPLYLAPDYTLNPAGPASSSETDFKCPQCDKVYRGKHARSIWRRHLQDKHNIPLSAQPRRTRWDNDANRPKSEEEKRARNLDSKRRWARKNRQDKTRPSASGRSLRAGSIGTTTDGGAPSIGGSAGTPVSDFDELEERQDDDDDDGLDSADADSSFDATSVIGWSTEGVAAMNGLGGRGGSAQPQQSGAGGSGSNPFYPYSHQQQQQQLPPNPRKGASFAHLDPSNGGSGVNGRPPLRNASSMPPGQTYSTSNGYPTNFDNVALPPLQGHLPSLQHHQQQFYHARSPSNGAGSPYHPSSANASAGPSNPYSNPHPFSSHPGVVEQQHYLHAPSASVYDTHQLHPLLAPPLPSASSSASSSTLRRPASNPNPALIHSLYDQQGQGGGPGPSTLGGPAHNPHHLILAGQPAPVANSYLTRRAHSPAPPPSRANYGSNAGTAGGGGPSSHLLESPAKIRTKRSNLSLASAAGGPSNAHSHSHSQHGVHERPQPREDAAGILLALKAGPSSPMHAHSHHVGGGGGPGGRGERPPHMLAGVQSPVSNLRDRDGSAGEEDGPGGYGDDDGLSEDDDGGDEEDEEVEARLMGVAFPAPVARRIVHAQPLPPLPPPPSSSIMVSPQKRRRSESPATYSAPPITSSSSSGGEGSTAAAHALLATAKKAHAHHSFPHHLPNGNGGSVVRGSWQHASLVATPTPGIRGGMMVESSPAVGRGGVEGEGGESEAEMLVPDDEEEEEEEDLNGEGRRRRDEEQFSSSSSAVVGAAGRGRRGRSESPSRLKRRGAGAGAGSSSSGGGAASSSSSQPRTQQHHHYPVGLTSELGDFGLDSAARNDAPHHHHDPLREAGGSMLPPPPSSSNLYPSHHHHHLATPASSASALPLSSSAPRATTSAAVAPTPQHHRPQHHQHHHDPFLSAVALSSGGVPPAVNSLRGSSPPFSSGFGSYLFSSPAHPGFSKTLGLTAAPGPGVLSYHPGAGDTPGATAKLTGTGAGSATGGEGAVTTGTGRVRELSGQSVASTTSQTTLDGLLELKTPARVRLPVIEGAYGAGEDTPGRDSQSGVEEGYGEEENGDLDEDEEGEEEGSPEGGDEDEEEDE